MGQKGDKHTSNAADAVARYKQLLSGAGNVTSKKMFGGYGLFEKGVMFGLVNSAGEVCFKVDESNVASYEEKGAKKHGKMPYYSVPLEVVENRKQFLEWAGVSIALAHKNKKS